MVAAVSPCAPGPSPSPSPRPGRHSATNANAIIGGDQQLVDATCTVVRLVYLPLSQSQSPRIFSFDLAADNSSSISIGSHTDAHVRVTTASICPHQCRISLSLAPGTRTRIIDVKNTGQSLFLVNNSAVSPDSPPLQLCTGDLLVFGANQDRRFRIEIVHPLALAAAGSATPTLTPTPSPSSSFKSKPPTTPSHIRSLPPGIAATPASIRTCTNALVPRTPSTAPSRSSSHYRHVHPSAPISLTQPRPVPPSSTSSSSKSVKWGPPLRPQLFHATDPPSSPVARGATPPLTVDDDASSPSSPSGASSPLAGKTPRSILKKHATAAAVASTVKGKLVGVRSAHIRTMARLLPKSSSPLRGSSFKFSAPQTGPSAVASVSLPTPGAATFAARPNRPPTPSMPAPTSDADESELSDLPSSPSPAPLSKSVTATGAKPETAALTPTKSSNRSSLSSHLPLTTSPSSTGAATRHAPSPAATVAVAAMEIAHAIPALVAATRTRAHDPDQVLGSHEGSPGRKHDVELVMVSDSESDMSMVSTTACGDESHTDMNAPPRVMMATRSPLHPPPEPCIKNENVTPTTLVQPRPDLLPPSNHGRTPASPAVRKYVRPATAPVLAATALPVRTTNKRARCMVDDDETNNLSEDDGEDGRMLQGTPSKKAKVAGGSRARKKEGAGGLVATEGLRRSMRVRTPVKRLGTF